MDLATETAEIARLIAKSQGKRIEQRFKNGRLHKDPIWQDVDNKVKAGEWAALLEQAHTALMTPRYSTTSLNLSGLRTEHYLLTNANAQDSKSALSEHYEAVKTVLDAYKDLYEKKIDAMLSQEYQRLAKNFKYSTNRVEQAQRRYVEFLQGKKFKISKGDQEILDKITEIGKIEQTYITVKKLHSVSKVFHIYSSALELIEWIKSFNKAQKTGDWADFWAKVSASSAGMLIGAIVTLGISTTSLPVAFVIAVLGVLFSHYATDEDTWRKIHSYLAE